MSKKNVKLKVESGKWWTLLLLSIFHFPLSIFNSYAYEVSSLSTSSSPVFVKTQDGAADLTYPVLSGNTFGSPDWYEEVEKVCFPMKWKIVRSDGVVATNNHENYEVADCDDDEFATWPTKTWACSDEPSLPKGQDLSPWFMYQDMGPYGVEHTIQNAMFPDSLSSFNNRIEYPCPYPFMEALETYVVPLHDPSGPGTIEFRMTYDIGSPTNVDQKTVSVTMFPVEYKGNYWRTKGDELYGVDTEIWLPKFQRLTPASRSALIAAYEAYFERMYYGSKGVTDSGEDEDEWTLAGLGSSDAGPDFVLWSDKWGPTNVTDLLPDVFSITSSAYSGGSSLARRHYPSSSFRVIPVDTNGVNTLLAGVRGMCGRSGFSVGSDWSDLNPTPGRDFCGLSQFLARPQWLLDGRGIHVLYGPGGSSQLWWSSRVSPPACQQTVERTGTKYTPDFTSVFPKISTTYYSSDGDTDKGIKASTSFHDDLKAAQYLFTFSDLESSENFINDGMSVSPISKLVNLVSTSLSVLNGEKGYLDRYECTGLTFPGFLTNCVRQAARSLPLRSDAMSAYEARFAVTSSPFRVDSSPLAAVSHALGVMDRTIHVPAQNFISTNVTLDCLHSGSYASSAGEYEIHLTLMPTNAYDESEKVWYQPGFVISAFDKSVKFTAPLGNTSSNFVEVSRSADDEIVMFADHPSDFSLRPAYENLGSWDVAVTNEPYRGYEIGSYVIPFTRGGGYKPLDSGTYALSPPVEWEDGLGGVKIGPIIYLTTEDDYAQTIPPAIYDENFGAKVTIGTNTLHATRSYQFSDFDSNAGLGFRLGPVMAGVSSSKPEQSSSIGYMCGGHVNAYPDFWSSFTYDLFSSGSESCDSRSSALSKANKAASDLARTLSNQIKDKSRGGVPESPRDPARYAPLADRLTQTLKFDFDEATVYFDSYHLDDEIYLTETRDVGEEVTVSNMLFLVEDGVSYSGTAWYSCPTTATASVTYEVLRRGRLVSGEFVVQDVQTNETVRTTTYSGGPSSLVRDDVLVVRSTNVVVRRVQSGDPVNPYTKTVSSNVTVVTSFDGKKVENATYNVYRFMLDTGMRYFERTETSETESQWQVQPYRYTVSSTSVETVQLDPADAEKVDEEKFKGLCRYAVMLTLKDVGGGRLQVNRISFDALSPTNAPDIPDASKWYVCGMNASADRIRRTIAGYETWDEIEYDKPTNRTDHADGAARPAVLMWSDWTWNALKRD